MLTAKEIRETNRMIEENNLDVRTITMGISLRDCAHPDVSVFCDNIYEKITRKARDLVRIGEDIEREFGVPIINKRISVTPIAIVAEACRTDNYVRIAEALDRAADSVGVNFIGGFSALVEKGCTIGDERLIASLPEALATTGKNRSAIMPQIPTVNEAGVPKYETTIWLGIMAPKGTPPEAVTILNNAIPKIISQSEVKDTWAKQGALPLIMSPSEFNKYLDADIAKWSAIVKSAGIKPD